MPLIRWMIWIAFLVVWTTALLYPIPEDWHDTSVSWEAKAILAKSLHLVAYCVLTLLSAWLPLPPRLRPFMIFFLMLHATGTELVQDIMGYRGGKLSDVVIDQLGIFFGLLFSLKRWTN